MIAFGYTRVSGKGQVDGDGPERQQEAIARFCQAHNLGEPRIFYDAAVSGTVESNDRPQFVAMIEEVERVRSINPQETVCLVVERQDRLARKLIVQELLLSECLKLQLPVYSADRGELTDLASTDDDPTRKVIRQILGAMAEWEKSVLVMKLRSARERKRIREGRCEGPLPFGQLPGEERIKNFLVMLMGAGYTLASAASKANLQGMTRRKGLPWTPRAVWQVTAGHYEPIRLRRREQAKQSALAKKR